RGLWSTIFPYTTLFRSDADDVAGVFDDHALQTQAQPECRNALGAGVVQRSELALDAADAEPAGHADRVESGQGLLGTGRSVALIGLDPADPDLRVVGETAMAQRLGHRQVGVGQVDVLADDADRDLVGGVVHAFEHPVPPGPVDIAEGQVEAADDEHVEAAVVEDLRDVVDAQGVDAGDDGLGLDIAGAGDLRPDRIRQLTVRAQDDGVGLDADRAQRRHRVLGRLRVQLGGGLEVGHEGDVDEEYIVAADVVTDLARRLEEGLGFDVADGAADLGDDDIGPVLLGTFGLGAHPRLDLVGDVRDDLD